jgi:hypothetical protein
MICSCSKSLLHVQSSVSWDWTPKSAATQFRGTSLSYQPPCDGHKNVDYWTQWSLVNILDIAPMVAGMKVFGDHRVFRPMVKARVKFQTVDKHPMVTIDL